jgi:hypothetical protein
VVHQSYSQLSQALSIFSSEQPTSRSRVSACWSTPTARCYRHIPISINSIISNTIKRGGMEVGSGWCICTVGTSAHPVLSLFPLSGCLLAHFIDCARARRHNNLALLQQYGNNAWRVHNYLLEADAKKAEKLLEELKEETTSLNRERKNNQVNHPRRTARRMRC